MIFFLKNASIFRTTAWELVITCPVLLLDETGIEKRNKGFV
jgi:hypothetical protein